MTRDPYSAAVVLQKVANACILTDKLRRMGPGLRRDDADIVSHSRDAWRPRFTVIFPPSNQRAQGMPDARCTRGLMCDCAKESLHMSIQGSGEHPTFPAQWLYGLCRALPGDEFLVDSVTAVSAFASQLKRILQLDACNGRQDHTVLPYACIRRRQA